LSKAYILPANISISQPQDKPLPDSIIVFPGGPGTSESDAERYDSLNKADLVETFENALRTVEPDLKRTSLGLDNGRSIIHADVGYGLVPFTTLGSGSKRLSTILLALTYGRKGVVLIDELENGFHHSALEKVWNIIYDFANNNGTQVFATTHSNECIQAAYNKFQNRDKLNFQVHRIEKQQGKIEVHTFNCKIRSMSSTDSGACRPLIPEHAVH